MTKPHDLKNDDDEMLRRLRAAPQGGPSDPAAVIGREQLQVAQRALCRRIASALAAAMAEADADFEFIGKRLNCPPDKVRAYMYTLLDGALLDNDFMFASSITAAMNAVIFPTVAAQRQGGGHG